MKYLVFFFPLLVFCQSNTKHYEIFKTLTKNHNDEFSLFSKNNSQFHHNKNLARKSKLIYNEHERDRVAFIRNAKKQQSILYKWGGSNPKEGFDCSGLIQYVIKETFAINFPRTTIEQFEFYKDNLIITNNNFKYGDLIYFNWENSRKPVSHVGIFVGKDQFIHSPKEGENVQISKLTNGLRKHIVGYITLNTIIKKK